MSLTEELRAGTPNAYAALYDEHAGPLHTYSYAMVGDGAAETVRDVFVAVARHPEAVPLDENVLPVWLHALARAECARHGALDRGPATTPMSDPLWRALAGLEPEDRDVLALSISLVPEEIAWILDVTPDTAAGLVRDSRRRLEHALSADDGQEAHVVPLDEDTLRRRMRRLYEPPEDQSQRVVAACADAERTFDETSIFDADGMPVMPDPPAETADASPDDDAATGVEEKNDEPSAARAEQRRKFRGRRVEGLLQAGSLAALVLLAVGVMAVRSDHSSPGSSGDGGKSRTHERKHPADPPVQILPPPQIRPSAPPATAPTAGPPAARDVPLPKDDPDGGDKAPPPSDPDLPFPPAPPFFPPPRVHHSKTPTPSPSDEDSGSPTPTPGHRW
ncbi:hypothetical protein [Actinomadura sp. DC4]|uniref:RNA polymerase sigma factor n=1 Tax=Actinomadura sp. DC4 TaxID=3055069 RepID=UPI0025B1B8B5|nr:hypothetical protein [Actinomadura sp. DC4]MDN3357302.1 hypothetical protein [Actinomadura sp. DC4]